MIIKGLLPALILMHLAAMSWIDQAHARAGQRKDYSPRIVRLKMSLLIPGQSDVGMKEVEIKLNHFLRDFDLTLAQFLRLRRKDPADEQVQKVLSSVNFSRFLSKRNIQAVRDPLGRFQIFDGHHLAMSLTLLEIEYVDVELHEDFWIPDSARSRRTLASRMEKYRTYMIEHNLVRLVDRLGREINFDDLPEMPADMKNNPFRSLAWILKKIGIYDDLDQPMQEFDWAALFEKEFRKRGWDLKFQTNSEFMTAVNRAINVLTDTDEEILAKLPGYLKLPAKLKKRRDYKAEKLGRCERLLYDHEV